MSALWLSLVTSTLSLAIVILVGTPFAYVHTRCTYPGKMLVDTLIDLPLVLPPAVAGVALLVLYGRAGFLGQYFSMLGISIAFTTLAVIMAQIFVASPFYLRQAKSLFEQFDLSYEHAARTLGASPVRTFLTITLPLTAGGLVSGAVMTFGRALGEFGATIMFAGNLPGVTQTMPLAVYVGMEGNLYDRADDLDPAGDHLVRHHDRSPVPCPPGGIACLTLRSPGSSGTSRSISHLQSGRARSLR